MGYVGSETRSLGEILEKSYVLFSRHSSDSVCKKLCQNVCHHEILDKFETGSWVGSKSRSIDQILEKTFVHSKGLKVLF